MVRATAKIFVLSQLKNNLLHQWTQISDGFERKDVQGALFSFTSHEFKRYLKKSDSFLLEKHFVNKSDRISHLWEREPMVKECWTKKFFRQTLNYIHFNHCQPNWTLQAHQKKYKWSSANFYETGVKNFDWLKHFND